MLPFHVECTKSAGSLFQLGDGRYQFVKGGSFAPLMVGFDYVLVNGDLQRLLSKEPIAGVTYNSVTIYSKETGEETQDYSSLNISEYIDVETVKDLDVTGRRMYKYANECLFVSPELKQELESQVDYLRFSEGFSEFAGT